MHAGGDFWRDKLEDARGVRDIREQIAIENGEVTNNADGAFDDEDAAPRGNNFNAKDLKETNNSRKMSKLLELYRNSKSNDVNGFKEYVMAKGGDEWDFVFNNYICRGLKPLVDAIEVCTELVDMESINWTWQQSLHNMPDPPLEKYHTVLTSQRFLYRWCDNQGIDIWEFTEKLMRVLDKRENKINTFVLHGESNSGKTMMMKSVFDAFRLKAIVTNGASVGFTWQNATEKRVILNEEVLIAPTQTEEYKQIMAGEECMINVKCKPQRRMRRTPLLMTCNSKPWSYVKEDQVYENRCYMFKDLQKQEWLYECKKKINPKGWLYYVEATANRLQEPEQVPSPEVPMEDLDNNDLIELAEQMVNNVEETSNESVITQQEEAQELVHSDSSDTESSSESQSERPRDWTPSGVFNETPEYPEYQEYQDDKEIDCLHKEPYYECEQCQADQETEESEIQSYQCTHKTVQNSSSSFCPHNTVRLNSEGFFICVLCNEEM